MPAAPSVWPRLPFTEPIAHGSSRSHGVQFAERGALDDVAERGAGAVRLDEPHLRGRDAGPAGRRRRRPRAATSRLGAVRPLLRPSWLTAVPRIDRVDPLAVGQGVGQAPQHHDAHAVAAADAVGVRAERLAAAVRRGQAHPLVDESGRGGEDEVDAAGDDGGALARAAAS